MDLFVSFYMKKSRTIFWPEAFVEGVYFTVDISGLFIKDQMYIGMCIYVWVLNIIPLIEVSVFMPWQCCFVVWLKIRNGDPSRNFFIVQYCFTYPGFFAFLCEAEKCTVEFPLAKWLHLNFLLLQRSTVVPQLLAHFSCSSLVGLLYPTESASCCCN